VVDFIIYRLKNKVKLDPIMYGCHVSSNFHEPFLGSFF